MLRGCGRILKNHRESWRRMSGAWVRSWSSSEGENTEESWKILKNPEKSPRSTGRSNGSKVEIAGKWGSWRILRSPGESWRILENPGEAWGDKWIKSWSYRGDRNPEESWRILKNPGESWRILENPGESWRILEENGRSVGQKWKSQERRQSWNEGIRGHFPRWPKYGSIDEGGLLYRSLLRVLLNVIDRSGDL